MKPMGLKKIQGPTFTTERTTQTAVHTREEGWEREPGNGEPRREAVRLGLSEGGFDTNNNAIKWHHKIYYSGHMIHSNTGQQQTKKRLWCRRKCNTYHIIWFKIRIRFLSRVHTKYVRETTEKSSVWWSQCFFFTSNSLDMLMLTSCSHSLLLLVIVDALNSSVSQQKVGAS